MYAQTQFEAWLSLQQVSKSGTGLCPAPTSERRCHIVPILNANEKTVESLHEMWSVKTPLQAFEALSRPDVTVTNAKDKYQQLQKLLLLNDEVSAFYGASCDSPTYSTGIRSNHGSSDGATDGGELEKCQRCGLRHLLHDPHQATQRCSEMELDLLHKSTGFMQTCRWLRRRAGFATPKPLVSLQEIEAVGSPLEIEGKLTAKL